MLSDRRGRVINTLALFSGGPGFKSLPGDRLSWLMFIVVFLSPSRHTLMLGHDRFLPNTFKFIIHLPPFYPILYSLSYWKIVLK
jgi:hypothetical protein